MNITTKQFQILTDINLVWDFLTDIYDRETGSGVAAPFFEYALQSSWMDQSYSFLDRFWLDGDRVVAFVFYEAPVTDIFFSVRKGYEFLADEMVDYAVSAMPNFEGKQRLVLFNGQEYLKEAAAKRGFILTEEYEDRQFDFRNELNHPLPEGYHFVDPKDADGFKLAKLLWYSFGHGEKGPFEGWDREDCSNDWTPAKSYKGVIGLRYVVGTGKQIGLHGAPVHPSGSSEVWAGGGRLVPALSPDEGPGRYPHDRRRRSFLRKARVWKGHPLDLLETGGKAGGRSFDQPQPGRQLRCRESRRPRL